MGPRGVSRLYLCCLVLSALTVNGPKLNQNDFLEKNALAKTALQRQETMSNRYWPVPVLEYVVAICIVGFLWHVGRIVDAVAGIPGPDQQLIVACFAPGSGFNFDEAIADGASVSARDRDGATALMLSAGLGQFDHVQRLLEKGADINATDNDGRTPLMYAVIAGRLDMAGFLINYGADIQRRTVLE